MKKLLMILTAVMMLFCPVLTGCNNNRNNDPDNDENFAWDSYSYTNPEHGTKHWRDLEVEEGFVIDGRLDEEEYADLTAFSFADESNKNYKLDTKVYFGQKGAYIAATMLDPNLYFTYARPVYLSTSVIFTIDKIVSGNKLPSRSVDTLQMRIGVNGQVEQWMGRMASGSSYEYTPVFYEAMARTAVIGKDSTLSDVKFLQEFSAENVLGYNIEFFLPWSSIGLSEAPEILLVRPEYNKTFDMLPEETTGGRLNAGYRSSIDPGEFVPFDSDGVSSKLLIPDDSDWTSNSGIIQQDNAHDHKMFVKDANGNAIIDSHYYFEVDIAARGRTGSSEIYPKLGILAGQLSNNTYFYTIDSTYASSYTSKNLIAVHCNTNSSDWAWNSGSGEKSVNLGSASELPSYYSAGGTNYAKLAVMRNGDEWYFFVQDKLFAKRKDIRGFDSNTPSAFGLMTMNMKANFKNLSYKTGSDAVGQLNKMIGVFTAPQKVTYSIGESINLYGGKVTRPGFDNWDVTIATLSNANIAEYTIRGFDTTTAGVKTVYITVNGIEYSYQITVS